MGPEVKEHEVCPNCGQEIHTGTDGNIGLKTLVKEIREKARAEAEKLHAEAKADSDQILTAAAKRSETIKLTADDGGHKTDRPYRKPGSLRRKPAGQA